MCTEERCYILLIHLYMIEIFQLEHANEVGALLIHHILGDEIGLYYIFY